MASFLDRLKKAVFSSSKANQEKEKSVQWLKAKLDNFAAYTKKAEQEKIMKQFTRTKQPLTGQMIMYIYRAEHDLTLPFWDAAPLGIFVGPVPEKPTHFYSMNLHYIPPVLRAKFFDSLLELMTTKTIQDSSRFALTYKMLKGTQKFNYFRPCWKMYITKNVQSNIVLIPPDEWINVLFLESAQWQKAGKSTVYNWSRSQLR